MLKPLTLQGQGLARNSFREILPQAPTKNQAKLTSYVKRRQLTDALELLESRGYSGDVAIFVIASLQEVAP